MVTKLSGKSDKKTGKSNSLKKSKPSVNRRTSSIIKNIFGSSYQKQLNIKKAQDDASKLKNKNQLMRFVSEAKKNKLVQNSKQLPILLVTIILALNNLAGDRTLEKYTIQKNPVIMQIFNNKESSLLVKLNHLIRLFQNQVQSDLINTGNDNPDSILQIYRTYDTISKLIEHKNKKIKLDDPSVILNTVVFFLNARKVYKKITDEDMVYKTYFMALSKLKQNQLYPESSNEHLDITIDKKLDEEYLLLLQDILLCDVEVGKCGQKTTKLPNLSDEELKTYKYKKDFKNISSRLV